MRFKINIAEDNILSDTTFTDDVKKENKKFPMLNIGRSSYIEEAMLEYVLDDNMLYCVQVGRYTSIAGDVFMIIDMNHDYMRPCQGHIAGSTYKRPNRIKRKGQILIMNDCWIGDRVTIMSGITIGNGAVVAAEAVVTKDVPSYAIVAGNPARVIGYRFNSQQIDALNQIRWWNWNDDKIESAADALMGDIDLFIAQYLPDAMHDLEQVEDINIKRIEKTNSGEEKILLYMPDFEQDYPTYPRVIDAFVKSYANTNYELLLYIEEDELLQDKLDVLNSIFEIYEDVNCYVNLYIGTVDDERSLFKQVDAYITNRSLSNVQRVDMADLYGVEVVSSFSIPIFKENIIRNMHKVVKPDDSNNVVNELIKKLAYAMRQQNSTIERMQSEMQVVLSNTHQLSINQVAMNSSIDNLKYEIGALDKPLEYPIVESGEKAIELILNQGKSMCRFGDGEFAVIAGVDRQKFQRADERLGARLMEILQSKNDNVLVCIADIYGDLSKYNEDCKYNIRAYLTDEVRMQHYELLDMNRVYYDAYVTRPYASYVDNMTNAPRERFDYIKKIWDKRDLLIIEGEKTRLGVGNDLFANAKSIARILGPAEHAFDRYDDILKEAKKQDKNRLVLIAMGATATVLAYDLANEGFQALDIGHIDIEYEWMLAGKGKKVDVKYKYNNEVKNGDDVEDIMDSKYESEIIARYC